MSQVRNSKRRPRLPRPLVLPLPRRVVLWAQSVAPLLDRLPESQVRRISRALLRARFEYRCDERRFVNELLVRRSNFWVFRSSQVGFCGDFVLVDMSSPDPAARPVYVVDLKLAAPLRRGNGGIQLRNARAALVDLAEDTGIIAADAPYEALTGGRRALLRHLGVAA